MAKHGGYGMNPNNMANLMKQAQKMQQQMQTQAAELEVKEFSAAAGGGAVTCKITGKRQLIELKINPDAVDPEDVEMLEDMVMAAVNEALKQVDDANNQMMGKFTGGLNGLL